MWPCELFNGPMVHHRLPVVLPPAEGFILTLLQHLFWCGKIPFYIFAWMWTSILTQIMATFVSLERCEMQIACMENLLLHYTYVLTKVKKSRRQLDVNCIGAAGHPGPDPSCLNSKFGEWQVLCPVPRVDKMMDIIPNSKKLWLTLRMAVQIKPRVVFLVGLENMQAKHKTYFEWHVSYVAMFDSSKSAWQWWQTCDSWKQIMQQRGLMSTCDTQRSKIQYYTNLHKILTKNSMY